MEKQLANVGGKKQNKTKAEFIGKLVFKLH